MRKLLMLLIAVIIVAAGCTRKPSTTVVLDPALATLVPSDTIALAGVRMDPIRSTPIYQKYVAQQKIPQLEQFVKETGFDPRRDIWEFLIASNGKDTVVLARGKFAEGGMEPKLQREGVQRFGYKGYTLMGDDRNAVFFMNSSTGLAGRTHVLRNIIDQRGKSGGVPAVLQKKIAVIPSTNQIWFTALAAGHMPDLTREEAGNLANLNNFIGSVETITGGIDLRSGLKADVTAVSSSDADAKRLHDGLRGLIGMGRLSTPDGQRQMLRVYDSIKITQDKNTVNLNVDLPADLIDELMKMVTSFQPGLRRPGS
jgi:hypothetical protein